jgi:hypothetical protein
VVIPSTKFFSFQNLFSILSTGSKSTESANSDPALLWDPSGNGRQIATISGETEFNTLERAENMMWYYAAEGRQAGPVSQEDLAALVRSGHVSMDSLVWREGMPNWQPLREVQANIPALTAPVGTAVGSLPGPATGQADAPPAGQVCSECGKLFPPDEVIRYADRYVCAACKPVFVQRMTEGAPIGGAPGLGLATTEQILAREYRVDIAACLQRAWKLFTDNAGMAIVAPIIIGAVYVAGAVLTSVLNVFVPLLGMFLSFLYSAPLGAGLLYYFVRLARNENASLGDLFIGFKRGYLQLILGALVQMLVSAFCLVPAVTVAFFMGVFVAFKSGRPLPAGAGAGMIGLLAFLALLGIIGIAYLGTIWTFSTYLIVDKGMGFWGAMQLSRRMVSKAWWWTFLFLIVSGLVYLAGALVCGVGLLVSVPVFVAMKAYLYDDNFRDLAPQEH